MTTRAVEQPDEMQALTTQGRERYLREQVEETANVTAGTGHFHEEPIDVLSAVLDRPNMQRAYDRVLRNKGAPGVDGMTVGELKAYLKTHWLAHKEALLNGSYQPQPVRKVEIPKSGGGVRQLGIPTVLDRLIQQALHQVLSPVFEPEFSEFSYGFRPGRSAGQAAGCNLPHTSKSHRFGQWILEHTPWLWQWQSVAHVTDNRDPTGQHRSDQ